MDNPPSLGLVELLGDVWEHSRSARQRAASLLATPSADLVFVLTLEMSVRGGSREDDGFGTLVGDLVFQPEDLAGDLERAFHHGAVGVTIVAQEISRGNGLGATRMEIAQAFLAVLERSARALAPGLIA